MAVPGRHVDKLNKTLTNFCGGYLTNLVYQDVIMNGEVYCDIVSSYCKWLRFVKLGSGVFVAGTFFYLLVLKRIRPAEYFKMGFPIMGVVLAVITSLLLFNLSQTLLSVVRCTRLSPLTFVLTES